MMIEKYGKVNIVTRLLRRKKFGFISIGVPLPEEKSEEEL